MQKQASSLQISQETIDVIFSKELRMLLKMHEELLADLKNPEKPFAKSLELFMPFLKVSANFSSHNDLLILLLALQRVCEQQR